MTRLLGPTLLILLLALATYVMLADAVNLRAVEAAAEPTEVAELDLPLPQPWGGYAWRELARQAGDAWRADPDTAEQVLREAATRYPVDAVQWLDRARMDATRDRSDSVGRSLAVAGALQPYERRSLWVATQIALQAGQPDLAERQLKTWLRDYPRDTGQALFIGARWIDDPAALLDRVLPEGREFVTEALNVARRNTDFELADAAWARLDPKPGLDDAAFLDYVELLLDTGRTDQALAVWRQVDPTLSPAGLANGSFDRPLGESLALNWRTRHPPPGVVVERDTAEHASAPASLKVAFNGKENVQLGVPWIRVPVEPGQRYRLTGAWRADELTTRALPYLRVHAEGAALNEREPLPAPSFDWQDFDLEFETPAEARIVRIELRRDRTNAFDRYIDGRLWLDDLALEPLPEEALEAGETDAAAEADAAPAEVQG